MKKASLIFFFVWSTVLTSMAQFQWRADSVLGVMEKVADWQLQSWDLNGMVAPKWDWTNAAAYTGFMALNKYADEAGYLQAMYRIGEALNWETGPRRTMADDYCVAQMFCQMDELYHNRQMIADFKSQADSIASISHVESLEWKDHIEMKEWAWCDALFMGPPSLAFLSTATGDPKYLDLACRLWWKTTDYLYDTVEHLYARDSRYFNQQEANGKKMFWSRGNGWVMGGLVRMLENMPEDYPARPRFLALYQQMAVKIASLQQSDGSWHAALLDPESYPAKETSGTGFFCYALAWGINHGILTYAGYYPVVIKAWNALTDSVHPDGELGFVQKIGEKPDAVDYNSTESYGVGSFLLAGAEMLELMVKHSGHKIISIYNPSSVPRVGDLIELPAEKFIEKMGDTGLSKIRIINVLTGKEIPYQLECSDQVKPVNVLMQVSVMPGCNLLIRLSPEHSSLFPDKTHAQNVPGRYDDFAWENDRIGFRIYGKALEKTNENGYGIDIWSKRTDQMVLDKWYKNGDYHNDHGEGMDFYEVGSSLGAGNMAPYIQDSIYFSHNYTSWRILDNGPLRSEFRLDYAPRTIQGITFQETELISLDAGSQLNKMEITYHSKEERSLPVAIGIVKRKEKGTILLGERAGIMGYWEPQHGKDGTMGIGCISVSPISGMKVSNDHLLMLGQSIFQQPFIYYAGAAWDKAGLITSANDWFGYLSDFQDKLQFPLVVDWSW